MARPDRAPRRRDDDLDAMVLDESEDSGPSAHGGLGSSSGHSEDAVILRRDDFSDFNEDNILPQPPDVLARIRRWLRPTGYDDEGSEYRKHVASHLDGTGSWLVSSDAYRHWHSSRDRGLLWIRGIPGSGKSVFAAFLINRLKREDCPVLYFFFRQIIDANHKPVAALRDWLDQVLVFSPPLQLKLKTYLDKGRELESLSSVDLWNHLRQAVLYIPRVYCVVDALDEMDRSADLEPFLNALAELGRWRPQQMKVIITSRPVAHIEPPLRAGNALHIRLEEHKVDVDIAEFVQHQLSHSSIAYEARDLIRKAVPGRANGLFLYAKLAMDAFLRPGADVAKVLQELPQDLNVLYADLLREHGRRSGVPDDIQLLIMQSVTHSTRPLRLLEIAELVDITMYPPEKRDLKAAKDLTRSACGSLLEILPDETVSVVHHSLTEFLNGSTRQRSSTSYPVLEPGPTHNRLAVVCLSYLLSGPMDGVVDQSTHGSAFDPLDHRRGLTFLSLPQFTQYAVVNWPVHVRKAALAGHDQTKVNGLLDNFFAPQILEKWASLLPEKWGRASITPLFAAVRLGLTSYLNVLLDQPGVDVDDGREYGCAPLSYAAQQGYDEIVELLLEAGASITQHTMASGTPLLQAASHNHPRVITLLVEAGDDPFRAIKLYDDAVERRGSRSISPIKVACEYGHEEAMRAFLPYVKTSEQANRVLNDATSTNRPGMVEMLLQHPLTKVNAKTDKRTALYLACCMGYTKIIRLLLQAGADPNILHSNRSRGDLGVNKKQGDTALQALARSTNDRSFYRREEDAPGALVECFSMLTAAGARVDLADNDGNTALHRVEDPVIARLLLDAGANPNATNRSGETPLHRCANGDVLRLLLEYSRHDLEQKGEYRGLTPLLSALDRGNMQLAIQLLELGARSDAVDDDGHGVFHHAANHFGNIANDDEAGSRFPGRASRIPSSPTMKDFQKLVQQLQESGGDINLRDRSGRTSLHALIGGLKHHGASEFSPAVLSCLVAAGGDLEVRDNKGWTPLFYFTQQTSSYRFLVGFENLLREGAEPNTRDFQGRTLFHTSIENMYGLDCFEALIGHGLDPKETDYQGNTLWHQTILNLPVTPNIKPTDGHPDYLRSLLKLGLDPTQPNHSGRTPLHQLSMFRQPHDEQSGATTEIYTGPSPSQAKSNYTWLEYLIQRHFKEHGVDQADNDGVTALHIASTHSEFNTRCLLEAGADPLKATHQGLTALHLAARSRQPNILGLLLETIKLRTDPDVFIAAVNARDSSYLYHGTPLHYACASGEVESARLLLEAGAIADIKDPHNSHTQWHSCLGFEEEARNWPRRSYHPSEDRRRPDARAVLLDDKSRGKDAMITHGVEDPQERLDEILDLLASSAPPPAAVLDDVIFKASFRQLDYTVGCLTRIRKALRIETSEKGYPMTAVCRYRRDAARRAINDSFGPEGAKSPENPSRSKYRILMTLRDFDAAAEALLEDGGLQADAFGLATIHELVGRGFAAMLKRVVTKEVLAKLEDRDLRQQYAQENGRRRSELHEPILLAACQTEVPNMPIVRVLVEDLGLNVNVQRVDRVSYPRSGQEFANDDGALHLLVKGNHWWQTAQAMPYLVRRGGNLELRNGRGETPLLSALSGIPYSRFHRRAVDALIALGADVNAADAAGATCLAWASGDIDTTRLLLKHGAMVTSSALAAAIDGQRVEVLKVLLEHSGNPNAAQTDVEREVAAMVAAQSPRIYIHPPDKDKMRPDEMYPIHRAATRDSYGRSPTVTRQMMEILLEHGADPNIRYPGAGTTLMHQLIAHGRFARLFLQLPSLDLESRDADGHTLLLAACLHPPKDEAGNSVPVYSGGDDDSASHAAAAAAPVQMLLDRGANVRARGADGTTALLALVSGHPNDAATVRRIALAAPELVNAADARGLTPLLAAVAHFPAGTAAAETLLAAGADVRARLPAPRGQRQGGGEALPVGAVPVGYSAVLPGDTALHTLLSGRWHVGPPTAGDRVDRQALLARLLAAGADAEARNAAGETPLFSYFRHATVTETYDWPGRNAAYRYVHRFMDEGAPEPPEPPEPPEIAEARRQLEMPVWALFEAAGMDFGTVNDAGESLLHVVAANRWVGGSDSVKRFRFLLARGLDPLCEDGRSRTPLDIAASVGADGILELFKRDPGEGAEEKRG